MDVIAVISDVTEYWSRKRKRIRFLFGISNINISFARHYANWYRWR